MQGSLSSFSTVATAKWNQTLNEENDWGSKLSSLSHKNIYLPHPTLL